VPPHNDFEVLEIVPAKAQRSELNDPLNHDETQRRNHEAYCVDRPQS